MLRGGVWIPHARDKEGTWMMICARSLCIYYDLLSLPSSHGIEWRLSDTNTIKRDHQHSSTYIYILNSWIYQARSLYVVFFSWLIVYIDPNADWGEENVVCPPRIPNHMFLAYMLIYYTNFKRSDDSWTWVCWRCPCWYLL